MNLQDLIIAAVKRKYGLDADKKKITVFELNEQSSDLVINGDQSLVLDYSEQIVESRTWENRTPNAIPVTYKWTQKITNKKVTEHSELVEASKGIDFDLETKEIPFIDKAGVKISLKETHHITDSQRNEEEIQTEHSWEQSFSVSPNSILTWQAIAYIGSYKISAPALQKFTGTTRLKIEEGNWFTGHSELTYGTNGLGEIFHEFVYPGTNRDSANTVAISTGVKFAGASVLDTYTKVVEVPAAANPSADVVFG